jgi:hypothetical protein
MLTAAGVMFVVGGFMLLLLGPYPDFGRVTTTPSPSASSRE